MTAGPRERWAAAEAYEPYVGRWSRLVARDFVAWLDRLPGGRWLDVGCGTGALTATILATASPAAVVGVDASAGYIAWARRQAPDRRARFSVADARALPLRDGGCDAVVSALMLNFVPAPERAVAEMRRAACAGAVVAAYVWDYAEGMQLMRYFWDAAAALDPAARELDEGPRFPMTAPARLAAMFAAAPLSAVATRAIDVATVFRDFDDYWMPFLGGQGPAPGYCMSLGEPQRQALRERLRATLPIEADGSIHLVARAWAVRGTVP